MKLNTFLPQFVFTELLSFLLDPEYFHYHNRLGFLKLAQVLDVPGQDGLAWKAWIESE